MNLIFLYLAVINFLYIWILFNFFPCCTSCRTDTAVKLGHGKVNPASLHWNVCLAEVWFPVFWKRSYFAVFCKSREQHVVSSRWTTIRKTDILTLKEVATAATYRRITKLRTLSTDRRLIYVFSVIFSIKRVHLSVKHWLVDSSISHGLCWFSDLCWTNLSDYFALLWTEWKKKNTEKLSGHMVSDPKFEIGTSRIQTRDFTNSTVTSKCTVLWNRSHSCLIRNTFKFG